ncbi:MAG TPA: hypothetical protein VJ783_17495 [Pirellulales bacterium]|nr:hypothetical protein [Pirellulales bacterium]
MTTKHLVVEGTVKPDGSLELDARLTLPPGRVQLVVQPLPELPKNDPFWERMKQIWAGQKARGQSPRTKEEIDASTHALRAEAEDEMQQVERLHEECRAARRGTDQTKREPSS